MVLHPVLDRELRVAARRASTYRLRALAGLGAGIVCFWVFVADAFAQRPSNGGTLFTGLTAVALVFSLLSGAFFSADCLSEEKREGTLGFLFLAELSGYEIVLGKLLASSLHALYGVLAILPVLSIPVVIGGVSLVEFGRMVCLLMNTLFVSLAVGMLASACCRRAGAAQAATVIGVSLMVFGLPLLDGWDWRAGVLGPTAGGRFALVSPLVQYYLAFDSAPVIAGGGFWTGLLVAHGLSWILLGAGGWILPTTWQVRGAVAESPRVDRVGAPPRWLEWTGARAQREAELEINPFQWLATRTSLNLVRRLMVLGACILGSLVVFFVMSSTRGWALLAAMLALHTALKVWVSSAASHRLATDRREGTLELLLITRLRKADFIHGQFAALMKVFLLPVVLVLCFDLFLMLMNVSQAYLVMVVASLVMLVADLYTLAWVGMWMGLSTSRSTRAVFATLGRVLLAPWVIFVGLLVLTGANSGRIEPLCIAWLTIGVVSNLFFWVAARRGLKERFEELALQRREPPRSASSHWSLPAVPAMRGTHDVPAGC